MENIKRGDYVKIISYIEIVEDIKDGKIKPYNSLTWYPLNMCKKIDMEAIEPMTIQHKDGYLILKDKNGKEINKWKTSE